MELSERVAKIEAVMSTLATKSDISNLRADMHKELHLLSWRLIGFFIAAIGVNYSIARYIH